MTRLAAALAEDAAALGLAPNERQIETLIGYLRLLERWNKVHNLTAIRDPADMLTQHVVDCLTLILPLQRQWPTASLNLLDVGSGGGLPGLVIATMLEAAQVTCVDAVGKKAAFVRQAAGELGLKNVRSVHARVESMGPQTYDIISCRAFASLQKFAQLTEPLMRREGLWLAMKGHTPVQEILELPPAIEVFHVEQVAVPRMVGDRCLVWMHRRPTL